MTKEESDFLDDLIDENIHLEEACQILMAAHAEQQATIDRLTAELFGAPPTTARH